VLDQEAFFAKARVYQVIYILIMFSCFQQHLLFGVHFTVKI